MRHCVKIRTVTHVSPSLMRLRCWGLRSRGWPPVAHALRCCTQRPRLGAGWTPAIVRLGARCRRGRLGASLQVGTGRTRASWDSKTENLIDAPCMVIVTSSRLGTHAERSSATPSCWRSDRARCFGSYLEQGHYGTSFRVEDGADRLPSAPPCAGERKRRENPSREVERNRLFRY